MTEEEAFENIDPRKQPEVNPQFAEGKLEPRYMFLMRTDKDPVAFRQEAIKDMIKLMPNIPPAMIEGVVSSHPQMKNPCTHEVHVALVAEDIASGEGKLFLTDYHKHQQSAAKIVTHEIQSNNAKTTEELIFNAKMNGIRLQHETDWKGTRRTPNEFEVATWGEFIAALQGEVKDTFIEMYPQAVLGGTVGLEVVGKVNPASYNRTALVAKFGEEKIAALEKKAGLKSIKVKHE